MLPIINSKHKIQFNRSSLSARARLQTLSCIVIGVPTIVAHIYGEPMAIYPYLKTGTGAGIRAKVE
jgi:hypothetical protein